MFMNRMIDRCAFDTSVRKRKRNVLRKAEGKKKKADYGILVIDVRNNITRIARQDIKGSLVMSRTMWYSALRFSAHAFYSDRKRTEGRRNEFTIFLLSNDAKHIRTRECFFKTITVYSMILEEYIIFILP